MSDEASSVFNSQATSYDGPRRFLIPPFEQFDATAVEALGISGAEPERILDIGAGTGMMTAWAREAYPQAHFTLLDGAGAMLDKARERLGADGIDYVQADFGDALPEGPWDAVVSALAIHHYFDEGKQGLFGRIHDGLRPGGVFVNAEHVAGPTPMLDRYYQDWHEASARAAGATDEIWAAAVERMGHDELSPLEDQFRWLKEAGFSDVDCLFKDHFFAVTVAFRAE